MGDRPLGHLPTQRRLSKLICSHQQENNPWTNDSPHTLRPFAFCLSLLALRLIDLAHWSEIHKEGGGADALQISFCKIGNLLECPSSYMTTFTNCPLLILLQNGSYPIEGRALLPILGRGHKYWREIKHKYWQIPDRISDWILERTSDQISDRTQDRISDRISNRTSDLGPWTGSRISSRKDWFWAKRVLWKFLSRGGSSPDLQITNCQQPVALTLYVVVVTPNNSYNLLAISHWTIDPLIHAPIGLY